ncbi:unnamed protein product, partial [Didymodactylos carnosus]
IAKKLGENGSFVNYTATNVFSNIMTEEKNTKKKQEENLGYKIRTYAPKIGSYAGGDDILLVLRTKINTSALYSTVCTKCAANEAIASNGLPSNKKRSYLGGYVQSDALDQLVPQTSPALIKQQKEQSTSVQSVPKQSDQEKDVDDFLAKIQTAIVELLIKNDSELLIRRTRVLINLYEENLLHKTIENGHTLFAQQMANAVSKLSDNIIEKTNAQGETAILIAAKFNNRDVLETLLTLKIDYIYAIDNERNNIFHVLSKQMGTNETIECLLNYLNTKSINIQEKFDNKNNDELTPIQLLIKNNNFDGVKMLIKLGKFTFDVNEGATGDSLIHLAVRNNSLITVQYLIDELKLDGCMSNHQMKPYDLARSLNHQDICDYLNAKYPPHIETDSGGDSDSDDTSEDSENS